MMQYEEANEGWGRANAETDENRNGDYQCGDGCGYFVVGTFHLLATTFS
ncbi:SNF2-like protein [Alicyclobacillus hesperidum URH17-3-68]|nr:SNF2-like protein [Alicyclobacillus hesperidum URH17-3-68]